MPFACLLFATLCDIAAVRNGDAELYRAGERFSVTGHVIRTVNGQTKRVMVWDCPDSLTVHVHGDMPRARHDVRYRIDGYLKLSKDNARVAVGERLVPVETNSLPVPVESTTARIAGGLDYARLVRVAGTVVKAAEDQADARYCWFTLRSAEGTLDVACQKREHPLDALAGLIGADVRLVGVPAVSATWRSGLPSVLILARGRPIEVTAHAETDPTKLPRFTTPQVIGRQRINGVVLAYAKDGFYVRFEPIKKERHTLKRRVAVVHPVMGEKPPPVGSLVTVGGFAALDGYHLHFYEALVKSGGEAACAGAEPPSAVPIPRLFADEDGHERIALKRHGDLVRVSGTVRDLPPASAEGRRIVIEDGGHRVGIDAELISDAIPEWVRNDAVIEVTGMLAAEYEPAAAASPLPSFRRFTVLPRSAGDLRLVRRAPWWTPRRLRLVIIVLLCVIVWISIWNRALKRLSEKRGEELYRERIAHAAAELKVEERTRLAVEIHDSISQTLTGIALQFDNGADEAVVRQMLASCRHELKSCLWDLRSRTFEEKDMTEAIRSALGPNAGNARIDVRFNVPRQDLSETTTHAILRIIRELVVNAIRHGKAAHVRIAGEMKDGTIRFAVTDDGAGFDPAAAAGPATGHFGLQGIRERLAGFRGKMEIESRPGSTRIVVTLNPNPDGEA